MRILFCILFWVVVILACVWTIAVLKGALPRLRQERTARRLRGKPVILNFATRDLVSVFRSEIDGTVGTTVLLAGQGRIALLLDDAQHEKLVSRIDGCLGTVPSPDFCSIRL